ncbi:MAG: STT3 domain-containing protein [Candidatus Heimdallarchaeota archaeon]
MAHGLVTRIANDLKTRYHFASTTFTREYFFLYSSLVLIFVIAFILRILPFFQYEVILSANDPYSQLRAAEYISEHGLFAFLSWVDNQTWYPEGRHWGKSQYLGTPLSAVFLHEVALFLGIDIPLRVIAYFQPAIMGSLTTMAIYFLGKELANKKVGLLSALLLAISAGHLQRTTAGFFDNEGLGILFLVLSLYFYSRALRTDSIFSAIFAGLSLGVLSGSWGASTYVFNLLALHAFLLVLFKKYSDRLLISYSGSILIGSFIMALIPRNGPTSLLSIDSLIPLGAVGFLVLVAVWNYFGKYYDTTLVYDRTRPFLPYLIILAGVGVIILLLSGVLTNLSSKFATVILPFFRAETPIFESVSEYKVVTWLAFFSNIGILIVFLPLTVYYLWEQPTERNFLLLLFGVTSIFFAGSMVRLALILAPAASLLIARGVDQTLLPFVLTFQERFALSRRKIRISQPLTNEHTAIAFAFIGLFLFSSVMLASEAVVQSIYAPSILTPVVGENGWIIGNDWQEAIAWLDYHVTINDGTVASWWDYGYWISGNSNTTILVDNATINSTKIANIGCMLVLNPRESLKIAKIYDVSYIILLVSDGYGGVPPHADSDLGKVPWFVRIGEKSGNIVQINQTDYLDYDDRGQFIEGYINKFYDSVFWALFTAEVEQDPYDRITAYAPISDHAPAEKGFSPAYAAYADYYELAYKTTHDWIYIWRIMWEIIPPGAIAS